jgi:hypothetical protein
MPRGTFSCPPSPPLTASSPVLELIAPEHRSSPSHTHTHTHTFCPPILSSACLSQVLCTQEVWHEAQRMAHSALAAKSTGLHSLKGFKEEVEIFSCQWQSGWEHGTEDGTSVGGAASAGAGSAAGGGHLAERASVVAAAAGSGARGPGMGGGGGGGAGAELYSLPSSAGRLPRTVQVRIDEEEEERARQQEEEGAEKEGEEVGDGGRTEDK